MPASPYEPPRTPIDGPPAPQPAPTVGYLIGGVAQLAAGAGFIVWRAVTTPPALSIFGLFLVFLGLRTLVKYKARTRNNPRGTAPQ
jgi:hypothetical protein